MAKASNYFRDYVLVQIRKNSVEQLQVEAPRVQW
jgi:hypothetical protein